MNNAYFVYTFEDGTVITLVNTGFSAAEVWKLQELHGKCHLKTKYA